MIKVYKVKNSKQIKKLDGDGSSQYAIAVRYDDYVCIDDMRNIIKWFNQHGITMREKRFYIARGKHLNEYLFKRDYKKCRISPISEFSYFIIIRLKDLNNIKPLETEERFEIGLRWLGDILVNAKDFANISE